MGTPPLGREVSRGFIALLGVCVVGIVDALTGRWLSFGIFYLIPIAWFVWHGTRRGGIVLSIVSAVTWYAVDARFNRYPSPLYPIWNASVRFGFFLLVALLLARVRTQLERERGQNNELARLNQALDDYATHVAHDLRSPIANVVMAVGMLRSDRAGDATDMLEIIDKSAARALQLIEDLLELAKTSATPQREWVDLTEAARSAAEGIDDVDVCTEGALHSVFADPVIMRQCFTNLFRNAVTYARKDGLRAEVTVSCEERPDGWVISVGDRGPGLDPDEQQVVFEPFVRGGNGDSHGTGLGLAIVAAAAAAHGGRAWYEPRVGGGSMFRILIAKSPVSI